MFLVFEGIDGCGKTTQVEFLAEALRARGKEVEVFHEPGGTELGEAVRELLLDQEEELSAETELFLFMAARSHLVETRIRPAISAGRVVICDRFLWSSIVYQGIVGDLGVPTVTKMGELATRRTTPTMTFVLDMPVPEAAARRDDEDEDRIERKGLEFQENVRKGFLRLANNAPRGVTVIDARGAPREVHQLVIEALPAL